MKPELKPNPKNPRKITDAKLQMLAKSLAQFGDLSGFIKNVRTGFTVSGHQRAKVIPENATVTILERMAAPTKAGTVAEGYIEFGGERYKYREVDVDPATEQAMLVAANQHGGAFELPQLAEMMAALQAGGLDMDLLGFDAAELQALLPKIDTVELPALPDGPKGELEQITFTLHRDQAAEVRNAIERAKEMGEFGPTGNENANGNALARVCEWYLNSDQ